MFSSDFDIWRNIDDPKVIGRIANCYSLMKKCSEEYDRYEKTRYEAFTNLYDSMNKDTIDSDAEIVKEMLRQNKINRIMDSTSAEVAILQHLLKTAEALNNRNKSELKVSQEALDEIGRLI